MTRLGLMHERTELVLQEELEQLRLGLGEGVQQRLLRVDGEVSVEDKLLVKGVLQQLCAHRPGVSIIDGEERTLRPVGNGFVERLGNAFDDRTAVLVGFSARLCNATVYLMQPMLVLDAKEVMQPTPVVEVLAEPMFGTTISLLN